jgi:hypothetical protein
VVKGMVKNEYLRALKFNKARVINPDGKSDFENNQEDCSSEGEGQRFN